jgi:hypothetical protein
MKLMEQITSQRAFLGRLVKVSHGSGQHLPLVIGGPIYGNPYGREAMFRLLLWYSINLDIIEGLLYMKKIILIIVVLFSAGGILFFWAQCHNAKEEPNAMTNLLSKDDINTINSYRSKYQSFPGPSDKEVLDVAKIFLRTNLSKDDIEEFLGKPSGISETTREGSLKCWRYDIGDSRGIALYFDTAGNIKSIQGFGVGFDTVMPPTEHK